MLGPVTSIPTTIVPTLLSTTTALVDDVAPFTFAVAVATSVVFTCKPLEVGVSVPIPTLPLGTTMP